MIDGADGDLARLTGRTSPIGEMVDGLCDYLSHIVLYLMLGAWLATSNGPVTGWLAWMLVVGAGLSHAVQANHV
ncbi:MAG: CDP-alcohol phosphatidyltransferase family protein, partial [Novosphingobium sp.]